MLAVNAKNAFALLPDAAWLEQVVAAERNVKVKKFGDPVEAFNYAAQEYECDNYEPGGELLWVPTLAQMELSPCYRDRFHDNAPVGGARNFLVISEASGLVAFLNDLEMLAAVFLDAPIGTVAWEVPDKLAAVRQVQKFVAKNVIPYGGYFPMDEFFMLKSLPVNKMVLLPYGAWMRANCILPPALHPYSLFGYADPVLNPTGIAPKMLPHSDILTDMVEEGGEVDV